MNEVTVGIGGAAGDGIDKSGDTLAKSGSRSGLHAYAFNSYQSVIRGGHIWLKLRLGQEKVYSQGDHLNALIALNQDSIERHAPEVESGGAMLFNADKLRVNFPCGTTFSPCRCPSPNSEAFRRGGRRSCRTRWPWARWCFCWAWSSTVTASVLADTFKHKGKAIIDQNVGVTKAGYDYAREHFVPLGYKWKFSRKRRPFLTGNEAISIGAVAAGCRFYSAYPMTPASGILTWMADHAERCGVVVKQMEDELAVANVAIGAGYAGVAPCAPLPAAASH